MRDFAGWRTVLRASGPRERDLLRESAQREALARDTAVREIGPHVPVAAGEMPATRGLPDPHGPDPVVFGSVPRVRNLFRD